MNFQLYFKDAENINGDKIKVIDEKKTLKEWSNKLAKVRPDGKYTAPPPVSINNEQVKSLINDSERKERVIKELLGKVEKITSDNKKLSNNQIKLLKRLEKLEREQKSEISSVPEF
jgi:hypothetical protein